MNDPQKRSAPAFPLYADDFLSGTADMSAEEVGGYIRLLCHQWAKGGLSNDEERLGRMAGLIGSPCLRYVVAKFALCPDGLLRHPRIEKIRAEREAFRAQQAKSGQNGAAKRWGVKPGDGNPNGGTMATLLATPLANAWPNDGSPLPSPSPSPMPNPKALDVSKDLPQGGAGGATQDPPADKPPARKRAVFVEPTREDLDLQGAKIGLPPQEVMKFQAYYQSNGWKVGRSKMKSWVGAMAGWKVRFDERESGLFGSGGGRGLTGAQRRNATLADVDVANVRANAARSEAEFKAKLEADPNYNPFYT